MVIKLLTKVPPDNLCDVCGEPAGYYVKTLYIHVCSEECLKTFEQRVDNEINSFVIDKLKGEK